MIFTMLIYVYPLKVVFGGMFYLLSGGRAGHIATVHDLAQGRQFFAAYALGFGATALEILLLNWRAWQLREPLRLDAQEQVLTRAAITGVERARFDRIAFAGLRDRYAARIRFLERLGLLPARYPGA